MFKGMRKDLIMATAVVLIVSLMILPLPPVLLDLLLALNISLSLTILLSAMYVEKPVEFSAFPSLLLITTLFRLAMNVASTRLILLDGASGPDAAGSVIEGFGNFVVGGSFIVGLIVFIILVIINFVVITKGSGRIAEVAARFTLDAMPGKQMAIDADLNAGLINDSQARTRRGEIEAEANFYGSMDGASKFVRGDAIAGILITGINIVAGFLIGVTQNDMSASDAAQTYTILTVGDGLVSQIPSLVISSAAGIIVTRAATRTSFGGTVLGELAGSRKTYIVLAGALFLFGLLPGMPLLIFWGIAACAAGVAYYWNQIEEMLQTDEIDDETLLAQQAAEAEEGPPSEETELKEMLPLEMLELNIGYALVPIVDESSGGDLLDRIGGIRRSIAQERGFIIPAVHIRDELTMGPYDYRVLLKGEEIATGEIYPALLMAIDPGIVADTIQGRPTVEPAFGLRALWIDQHQRDEAEIAGYTVVEPSAVIATHLSEIIRQHGHELLGRQEVQELVDLYAERHPKVVEELIPGMLGVGDVVKVLRNLLKEGISIRDMRTVLETLADHAGKTKDTDELTEFVRQQLNRSITRQYSDEDGTLHVMTLEHSAEHMFRRGKTADGSAALDPTVAQNLLSNIEKLFSDASNRDIVPVLLTAPDLRRQLRTFTERFVPNLAVLSYK